MEGSLKALSHYRLAKAKAVLKDAELLLAGGSFASSANRSYYALFHGLRSVIILDGYDSEKHSGIIAFFNRYYVKTGAFDKKISQIIDRSYRTRERSDYDDFAVISEEEAKEQLKNSKYVLGLIEKYTAERE